jgi:hypothetical protein
MCRTAPTISETALVDIEVRSAISVVTGEAGVAPDLGHQQGSVKQAKHRLSFETAVNLTSSRTLSTYPSPIRIPTVNDDKRSAWWGLCFSSWCTLGRKWNPMALSRLAA